MSKTAAEWVERLWKSPGTRRSFANTVQAIIDDARAGMVPEGELRPGLDALKAIHASRHAEILNLKAQLERLEASYGEHEAELAKAWEAGRDAAAQAARDARMDPDEEDLASIPHREGFTEGAEAAVEAIRAIQPPGGKAK